MVGHRRRLVEDAGLQAIDEVVELTLADALQVEPRTETSRIGTQELLQCFLVTLLPLKIEGRARERSPFNRESGSRGLVQDEVLIRDPFVVVADELCQHETAAEPEQEDQSEDQSLPPTRGGRR